MPTSSLTTGTPWRVIGAFTIPLVLGNVVQQAYQFVDAIVVGRFLGVLPLAAVGATGSLIWLITGFSWGMTAGLAIPIAQAFGAKDEAAVRRSVGAGIWITLGMTAVLTAIGTLGIRPLLRLLRTPESLMPGATTFGFITFAAMATVLAFNFLSAILRAVGDSRTPLSFLALATALNIALDLLLIGVVGTGVGGAAVATATAQLASALMCLWWIRRRFPIFRLSREDLRSTGAEIKEHLRLGIPLGFQMSITALGGVAIQVRLNTLGDDAVAAYTTAARVDGIAVALLMSLEVAVSTYVAQNWGARALARVRTGVTQSAVLAVVLAVIMGAVLITGSRQLVELFIGSGDATVLTMSRQALIVYGLSYWMLGILFVYRGALQGLGKMRPPFISGIVELVCRVAAAVWLGAAIGFIGVALANILAWAGAALLLLPSFLSARSRMLDEGALSAAGGRPAA